MRDLRMGGVSESRGYGIGCAGAFIGVVCVCILGDLILFPFTGSVGFGLGVGVCAELLVYFLLVTGAITGAMVAMARIPTGTAHPIPPNIEEAARARFTSPTPPPKDNPEDRIKRSDVNLVNEPMTPSGSGQ